MPQKNRVVLSVLQFTGIDCEKEAVFSKASKLLDEAGERGSDLVVLPELWTGLGLSSPDAAKEISEEIPGPATNLLAEKAKKYGMYVVGSIYERRDGNLYNSAPLVGPDGGIVGMYRKTHLFDAPGRQDIAMPFVESEQVTPGSEINVYDTPIGRIGLTVCMDMRVPEVSRVLAIKGAQIIVCSSAWPSPRYDHWELFVRTRALENQCFVVASGQHGTEPKSGMRFVGRSMIVDPWGVMRTIAQDEECCITSSIELSYIDEVRNRQPVMDQRRPELYGEIARAPGC